MEPTISLQSTEYKKVVLQGLPLIGKGLSVIKTQSAPRCSRNKGALHTARRASATLEKRQPVAIRITALSNHDAGQFAFEDSSDGTLSTQAACDQVYRW